MDAIELLAPARDLETGQAAINCGADAVYIGAARFGAREAAGNALGDLEQLVRYAHRYWARVYVTVNTLLHDHELPAAVDLIHKLYEIGTDAIILQDAGLLECDLPPIALYASTQMHNHSPERVAFLEKVGIRRAILARELSLDEIRAIRAATTLELEAFIHGALCVSYSGQCYASYALGGRSGNRGQCAQPCRRPYRLLDAAGQTLVERRHLLSLRDLNLSGQLNALLDAGVTSFKIEGRLKDRAYVMNVVGHYRRELDAILSQDNASRWSRASSGRVSLDFTPDPAKTFNRGFTTYFLHGRGAPLAAWDTPKSVGEPLGKVIQVTRRSFSLDTSAELHRGDGICFFTGDASEAALQGTTINDVQGQQIFPAKMDSLAPGTFIYRNHDHAFLAALDQSQAARRIAVHFRLARDEAGLVLHVQDEDGVSASATLPGDHPAAEKPEAARQAIERQLRRLGGTEFECTAVEIDLPGMVFIPLAGLNALRRAAVEALQSARQQARPLFTGGVLRNDAPFPQRELSFNANVLNEQAAAFYRRHGVTRIEPAAESGLDLHGRRVMTTRYCLKHELGACPRRSPANRLKEPLFLVDEQGSRFRLHFNCTQCVMEIEYAEES